MQDFDQTISTTVFLRFWPEPEISTPKNKKVTCSSFLVFSGQSSGTSIWVLQVSVNYLNVHLLANKQTHRSLFWN